MYISILYTFELDIYKTKFFILDYFLFNCVLVLISGNNL